MCQDSPDEPIEHPLMHSMNWRHLLALLILSYMRLSWHHLGLQRYLDQTETISNAAVNGNFRLIWFINPNSIVFDFVRLIWNAYEIAQLNLVKLFFSQNQGCHPTLLGFDTTVHNFKLVVQSSWRCGYNCPICKRHWWKFDGVTFSTWSLWKFATRKKLQFFCLQKRQDQRIRAKISKGNYLNNGYKTVE